MLSEILKKFLLKMCTIHIAEPRVGNQQAGCDDRTSATSPALQREQVGTPGPTRGRHHLQEEHCQGLIRFRFCSCQSTYSANEGHQ